jgi:hypothetical protein
MATDPQTLGPDGKPIVVPGAPGAVAIETVGSHPVVYSGQTGEGAPATIDTVDAALRQLFDSAKPGAAGELLAQHADAPLEASVVPLEQTYKSHAEARETADLERQLADLNGQDAHAAAAHGALQAIGAAAADVGKGVVLEGGQAVLSGAKRAVNETLDLSESIADQIPQPVVAWGDTDGNPATDNGLRVEFTTGKEFKAKNSLIKTILPRLGIDPKDEPSTVTGKVIEGLSQFGTGMAGAGKVLKGWNAATRAARVGKAMAQGAITDFTAFDGHQQRLSDMLAHVAPDQAKPIFEYLASNKDDPEVVGRLKNAVEGLGLGVASEGVFHGIRALKAARLAKAEARRSAAAEGLQVDPTAEPAALTEQAKATHEAVQKELGDPADTGSLVRKVRAQSGLGGNDGVKQAAAAVTGAEIAPNGFKINFARIETPDDVKAVISTLVDRFHGDVEAARRGQRSWEETQKAAGKLDWVASMAQRKTGDAVNAETALAYREALNASATKLLDLARKVSAEPSVANQFAFRKMMATHRAIQLELMGARAEAGRALNAFKIPAGTPERSLRNIDSLLADAGGADASQQLANKLLKAAEKGDTALNTFVSQGAFARTRAVIKLVYTNSLLTALGSPVRNILGNASAALLNVASRAVSPRMARALGDEPHTMAGEAAAIAHGYAAAIRDIFALNPLETWKYISANGAEALRRDGLFRGMAPGLDRAAPEGIHLRAQREEAGAAIGETMETRPAAAWGVDEDTVLGRALDVMQMVVEAPSNLNATADDFFKVIAARGELHAQAFRQAMHEFGEGGHALTAVKQRMQDIVDNPTNAMLDAAEREMHELTFTRSTKKADGSPSIADAFYSLRAAMDSRGPIPFGQIFLPFLRTPANLISMGMRYSPLAPFMRRFAEDLAEGGARAEIAKAQWAIGTVFWSFWLGMAADGKLTGNGPGNRAQKEALMRADEFGGVRWQPYSVKVGERWVSFNGVDPMTTTMSMAADMGEMLSNSDWDDERDQNISEVSAHAIAAIGQAFFDKTMLQSAMEATSAIVSGDPAEAEKMLKQRASGAVPASGLLRSIRRGSDPYLRTYQSGLGAVYDAVSPVQTKEAGGAAIDQEILNQGVAVTMPGKTITVNGEAVSLKDRPDIYEDFVARAGKPAFKQLEAVVTGGHEDSKFYQGLTDGPDGEKAAYIKDVINAYRRDAKAQILDRYASTLEAMAADKVRRRNAARQGAQ